MSEFMRYVNSNIARKIGRLYGWKEKFWAKRYSAIIVSDEEEAQVGRLKYLLSQGVKEGLVERPEDWPGLHLAPALQAGYSSITGGIWHDRSAQYRATQKAGSASRVRASDFIEKGLEIELEPLPCWRDLPWKVRRDAVRDLIEQIVDEAKLERKSRPVLGAEAVERQDPLSAPEKSSRRYAPPCHAASRKARSELLRQMSDFTDAFLVAADALRSGVAAHFPEGCFPPGLPYVAETSLPDG